MSPEQGRCHGLALDGSVANILKVWNDCRRNITDALRCYKKLRKDKGLRDNLSNQHKMSPEQSRCRGLALDGRVANILSIRQMG
ncbi:hypothetical protein PVK06_004380 [Gossypium arboreum]|uniref:Uncharacterized protein n=1 Tax=Gossypium arboreum TaxID=29729 RepID=A0ABR0QRU9_GOSAR|nr:hypothetical protein PVK06_004380 [Gossypium arboreum]